MNKQIVLVLLTIVGMLYGCATDQMETEYAESTVQIVPTVQTPTEYTEDFELGNLQAELYRSVTAGGANVHAKDFEYYDPPIIWAADLAGPEIITLLLEAGADIASTTILWGGTPLMWAALKNTAEAVIVLIEAGADLSATDFFFSQTALELSEEEGREEIVQLLQNAEAQGTLG